MSLEIYNDDLHDKLKTLARLVTRQYCYGCAIPVSKLGEEGKHCPRCGSDDSMRELPGEGCEYMYDWVIEHLVREHGKQLDDTDDAYEEMLDEIYGDRNGTINICGMQYSPGRALKEIDPVAFRIGKSEYFDSRVSDGDLIELDGEYYETFQLDIVLDELIDELESEREEEEESGEGEE
jgi:hypothetical protein